MINCVSLTEDCVQMRTISENSVLKIPKLLLQIMCIGSLFRSILSVGRTSSHCRKRNHGP